MNEKLNESYRQLLIGLLDKDYSEPDDATVVFNALVGKDFEPNREIMIVGRATNGWNVYFNRSKHGRTIKEELDTTMAKLNSRLDLTADIATWLKNKDKHYNIGGSQFWRVALRVTKSIVNADQDRTDFMVYSNLYKVAPDGKNPSNKLKAVTQEDCINLLKTEIEVFQPKRILFLTGYDNWAEPFLTKLKVVGEANPKSSDVQFVGKYGDIEIVVSVHPQGRGKNETQITNAIRIGFKLPLPIKI